MEGGNLLGKLPFDVRILGFGLVFAWNSIVFGTDTVVSPGLACVGVSPQGLPGLAAAVSSPLAFVACMFFGRKCSSLSSSKAFALGLSVAACIGVFALAASRCLAGQAALSAKVIGGLVSGAVPACLIAMWADALGALDDGALEVAVPASFAMTLVSVPVALSLNVAACTVFAALLPAVSVACCSSFMKAAHAASRDGERDAPPVGLAIVSTRPVGLGAKAGVEDDCRVSGALSQAGQAHGDANRMRGVARPMLMFFSVYVVDVVAGDMVPAAPSWVAPVACVLAVALAIFAIVFSARIDFERLSHWAVVPLLAGTALACVPGLAATTVSALCMQVAVTMFEVVLVIAFIRLARWRNVAYLFFLCLGEAASYAGVLCGSLLSLAVTGSILQGAASPVQVSLVLVTAFACLDSLVFQGSWFQVGPGVQAAQGRMPENQAPEERDPVDSVCALLARDFKLTPREEEILGYLARGRSQPYIREKLVLSRNTIASHVKHIYAKMDVHSRQELLDAVERRL